MSDGTTEALRPSTEVKTEAQRRKEMPIARGLLGYFPRACAYVAHVSHVGNEQHNKGEPMHWAMSKSSDHLDCQMRHTADHLKGDPVDTDGLYHLGKNGWRAFAALETFLWAVELDMPNPAKVTSADLEAELKRRVAKPTEPPGAHAHDLKPAAEPPSEPVTPPNPRWRKGDVIRCVSAYRSTVADHVVGDLMVSLLGELVGPGGNSTRWEVVAHRPADCPADYVPAKVKYPFLDAGQRRYQPGEIVWASPVYSDLGSEWREVWPRKDRKHGFCPKYFEVIS